MAGENLVDNVRLSLESWYQKQAGLQGAEITRFETPPSGMVNETYIHTVSFTDNGEATSLTAVLRIQPATDDTPIPNVDVIQQAGVLRELHDIGDLKTPAVYWDETDKKWLGRAFYMMEYLPGAPLFDTGDVPNDASVLRSLYEQTIDTLCRIHAVEWKSTRLEQLLASGRAETPLRSRLNDYRDHLDDASREKKYPLLEAAFEWLDQHAPAESSPVLNWGDARPGNLLFENGKLTAVLDWEIAEITAREVDLGWFLFFERFLRDNGTDVRPGAMSDDEILACYEQSSGVQLQRDNLDYFQRWAAFRLAVMRLRGEQAAISAGLEKPESRVDEINYGSIEMARVFGFPEPT